jgi:hypothetical protein
VGDQLLVYRPYLRANAEETFVFGAKQHSGHSHPAHSLGYEVRSTAQPGLLDFVPTAAHFATFHLLYGSVTVVARVQAKVQAPSNALPSALPSVTAPGSGQSSTAITSAVVRLLSIALSKHTAAGGPQTVVELWVVALEHNVVSSPTQSRRRLLCVRVSQAQFEDICGGSVRASLSCGEVTEPMGGVESCTSPLTCTPSCRPGQVLLISGLLTVHSELFASLDHGAAAMPSTVLQYLKVRGEAAVEVLHCGWGPTAADDAPSLFPQWNKGNSTILTAAGGPITGGQQCRTAQLFNLSVLPSLACSPSLLLPVNLAEALAQRGTVGAGCVLVHVSSLQPMHPSVRVCEGAEGEAALQVGQKRPAAEGQTASWGYQVVSAVCALVRCFPCCVDTNRQCPRVQIRLRDNSGEALCLIESVVALDGAAVVQVKQHLVNTSSSLFFDPSTGQLTRLTGSTDSGANSQLAVLLSRLDDCAECGALRQLRARRGERPGAAAGPLPVFRIEAICDANLAGVAAQQRAVTSAL